jgi:predicted secreted protein
VPNALTTTGLTIVTQSELVTNFTTNYQAIYGSSINLASNTPDGQMMMIYIQTLLDNAQLLQLIYNSFDPDQAVGIQLDMRVAINGIQRQAGTNTITNITLVMSQSVNLYGLDQTAQSVFTVADNAGNQWQLQTTQLGVSGTQVYAFQAANPGAVLTTPNTITIPVTVVLGVTSINNPTTYTTLGINAETDAALRIRRLQSVSLASQGYYASLLAALENINGVTSAFVYENTSSGTNVAGVPGHSIWVIVAGSGSAAAIAQAIYSKRNAGCGMYGGTTYLVTQVDGSQFQVAWDVVSTQNLFVAFTATSVNGTVPPNINAVRTALATSFAPGVFSEVNINQLATLVQAIDPNTLVTSAGFSLALTQTLGLSGVAASGTFLVNYNGNASAAINWNDTAAQIQTKLRAVTGLTACTVTGSIASQSLVIALGVTSALGLLYVTSNSLMTVAPAAITFTYNEGYTNTLTPTAQNNQFAVASARIVIVALQILPSSATVAHTATKQFAAYGGYGTYVWSLATNASGGSINSGTGLYTAGSTPNVTDVIQATDVFGNFITANITVT